MTGGDPTLPKRSKRPEWMNANSPTCKAELKRFVKELGGVMYYAPWYIDNALGIMQTGEGIERVWAAIVVFSWGKWSTCCCRRDPITGKKSPPLSEIDLADILGVDRRRVSAAVLRFREQGRLKPGTGRVIVPNPDYPAAVQEQSKPWAERLKRFAGDWQTYYPEEARTLDADKKKVKEDYAVKHARLKQWVEAGDRFLQAELPFTSGQTSGQSAGVSGQAGDATERTKSTVSEDGPSAVDVFSEAKPVETNTKTPSTNNNINMLLLNNSNNPTTTTKSSALALESPPSEAEDVAVARRLAITAKAAKAFLTDCRTASPDCTTEDILAVIDQVAVTIGPKVNNPTGVLLQNVPVKLAALVTKRRQREAEQAADDANARAREVRRDRERDEYAAKQQRLREHPEECERCQGAGLVVNGIARTTGQWPNATTRYESWESVCGCPAGEGKEARGSLGYVATKTKGAET